MKRTITALFCVMVLVMQTAFADGLFPSVNQMFGEKVPSVALILGREAQSDTKSDTARTLVFTEFSVKDYEKLSVSLAVQNCILYSSQSDANSAVAVVMSGNNRITLTYDYPNAKLTVAYPTNVRMDTEIVKPTKETQGILYEVERFVGQGVPTIEKVLNKMTSFTTDKNGALIEKAENISEDNYKIFGQTLGGEKWQLGTAKTENGTIQTSLSKGNAKITVSFTPAAKSMTVSYDTMAYKLDKTAIEGDNILPDPDSVLGISMPSMIEAIKRMPDKETTDSTGKTIQMYSNFTDEDYNAFSIYLKSENCNLDGYSLDGSVLTIELSKNDNSFFFVYDREQKSAKMIYPQGARPKQVILATAAPIPTPTPCPRSSLL